MPTIPQVLGAVLLGSGWVFIAMQVGLWQNGAFPMPENLEKEMERIFSGDALQWGLWGSLFVIALSPAICEEVLFRGAIMSGLRQRMPAWATILVVGLLFGLFHLSIYRVLVTGLSGVVIAYVVYRSGSIWLGVIIHFINNGTAVLLMQPNTQETLQPWFDVEAIEKQGMPMALLVVAAVLVAAGVVIVEASTRRAAARG
jgi:membrane protease YdiL (CAAX protease family)